MRSARSPGVRALANEGLGDRSRSRVPIADREDDQRYEDAGEVDGASAPTTSERTTIGSRALTVRAT